jgi:putative membrane protein
LISPTQLPTLNAALNSLAAILLFVGFVYIRKRNISAHKTCMLAAFATSTLFLISYVIYHYQVGSVRFQGEGWIRTVYFTVLISHTILATAVVPMALLTLFRGLAERYDKHRRIARWTFPIWLYVSITGVLVYIMLYKL